MNADIQQPNYRNQSLLRQALGCGLGLALLVTSAITVAAEPQAIIELDETVISGNQELPKVLYILPWQSPSGLPDVEVRADFTEVEVFRRLYPPAYRRELRYFETLDQMQVEDEE